MPGPTANPSILISCGEASGDVYAAAVAHELKRKLPEARIVGVGGPHLEAEVEELWWHLDQLSVMGFAEVLRHLPRLYGLRREMASRAEREGIDLFLAVDYPGFHVSLAGVMKSRGIPTLQFIPPKTWSWGRWRNAALKRNVHRCAVIFPFEQEYYRSKGIEAHFVGHPLVDGLDEVEASAPGERRGLLLVPGSRHQELDRIGPVLAAAVEELRGAGLVHAIRLSRAPGVKASWLDPMARLEGVDVVEGPLLAHLRSARAAIVTSGTATVEAALSRTPHVIVYRTSALTYGLGRMLATVNHIGMANIVLGRMAFPELVQGELEPQALARAVAPLLAGDTTELAAQSEASAQLIESLGRRGGAAGNVAAMAAEILDAGRA